MDELQGMVLKVLLDQLLQSVHQDCNSGGSMKSPFVKLFDANLIHIDRPFSKAFRTSVRRLDPNYVWLPTGYKNLRRLLAVWVTAIRNLRPTEGPEDEGCSDPPVVDDTIELVYHTPIDKPALSSSCDRNAKVQKAECHRVGLRPQVSQLD